MTDEPDRKKQIAELLKKIKRKNLARELDVGPTAISNAAVDGYFPPSWLPTVRRLGAEAGVTVPENLFRWRNPDDVGTSNTETTQ